MAISVLVVEDDPNIRELLRLYLEKEGYTVVHASAPKAELADYPTVLRAMTQGRGSFEYNVTGYDTVPQNVAAKIAEKK